MRHLALAAAAAAVLAFTATGAHAADETEHVTRTVKLDPGGTLRLKNFSGKVTITAADRSDVSIDAVRRWPRERLDAVKLDISSESSNLLVIDANHRDRSWLEFSGRNHVIETDFDITVPRRTSLDISVFSSPVTIRGVEGTQKVHTFSSRLQLDDVSGPVEAHSFSGSIEIRTRDWAPHQALDVHTFSGNIEVHVPEAAQANVAFNSFSGHLVSVVPVVLNRSSRRGVRARLGSAGTAAGELTFKTFSGNVTIGR
jgi:DUF4097 and DUF4098 domain-containing protein YvlB